MQKKIIEIIFKYFCLLELRLPINSRSALAGIHLFDSRTLHLMVEKDDCQVVTSGGRFSIEFIYLILEIIILKQHNVK